jgi:predicted flavoprotein YhiN
LLLHKIHKDAANLLISWGLATENRGNLRFGVELGGKPFKAIAIGLTTSQGQTFQRKDECVATATEVEGGFVYAASALLRDEIIRTGHVTLHLDLLPTKPLEQVLSEVSHPRGSRSLSSHLKSRLGIDIKTALL